MNDDLVARLREAWVSHRIGNHTAHEAADRIEQQAREIAALKADAERYRWLAEPTYNSLDKGFYISVNCDLVGLLHGDIIPKDVLDAAIDEARKST